MGIAPHELEEWLAAPMNVGGGGGGGTITCDAAWVDTEPTSSLLAAAFVGFDVRDGDAVCFCFFAAFVRRAVRGFWLRLRDFWKLSSVVGDD